MLLITLVFTLLKLAQLATAELLIVVLVVAEALVAVAYPDLVVAE
jgi:hypothetical protein